MRVLFVCTANLCRSRVAEEVFHVLTRGTGQRRGHEALSAGTHAGGSGRPLTQEHLEWAEVVVVMEAAHAAFIRERWPRVAEDIRVLGIDDVYQPDDPDLRELLLGHVRDLLAEAPRERRPSR